MESGEESYVPTPPKSTAARTATHSGPTILTLTSHFLAELGRNIAPYMQDRYSREGFDHNSQPTETPEKSGSHSATTLTAATLELAGDLPHELTVTFFKGPDGDVRIGRSEETENSLFKASPARYHQPRATKFAISLCLSILSPAFTGLQKRAEVLVRGIGEVKPRWRWQPDAKRIGISSHDLSAMVETPMGQAIVDSFSFGLAMGDEQEARESEDAGSGGVWSNKQIKQWLSEECAKRSTDFQTLR